MSSHDGSADGPSRPPQPPGAVQPAPRGNAGPQALPPPSWGLAAGVLGVLAGAWTLGRTVVLARQQGYRLWPPSPNALATLRADCGGSLMGVVLLGALVLLPWLWARRCERPARALAWGWAIAAAFALWVHRGFLYNRYDIAPLWKERQALLGMHVPRALVDGPALLHNGAITGSAAALAVAAYVLLRRPAARLRATRGPHWLRLTGIALLAAQLLARALPVTAGRLRPAGPDLILISMDATRADRLGCYGSSAGLTPALDSLSRRAVRFTRAYAQEPWTLTSHMSMLTGLDPDAHGLDFGRSLSPAVWTLAERLRDAGYRTRGSVFDCFLLDPRFGYAAGFDRYEVSGEAAAQRCRRAVRWLLADDRPAFLFLHLYDPHSDTGALPYEAPPERLKGVPPEVLRAFAVWTDDDGASERLRKVNEGQVTLPDSLRRALPQLYNAGVAGTDAAIGELLAALQSAGRLESALVIVLADHGEALGERGHFMHEELMEATLHIPFLLHWPQGREAGRVREDLVETVDVAPTLLAAAGLAAGSVSEGHDLRAADPTPRRAAFSRSGPLYAVTTEDGWRMLYTWEAQGPHFTSLRHVGEDQGDGPELLEQEPQRVDRWIEWIWTRHRADELLAARFTGKTVRMSGADEELLRSLGYIR